MTIENIDNATIVSAETSNFTYLSSIQFDEAIIRQISYVPDNGADGEIYMLRSDLTNSYIGTMTILNGQSVTNSNITIKLKQPFSGNINFKVFSVDANGTITSESDNGVIVIHMDFIKNK